MKAAILLPDMGLPWKEAHLARDGDVDAWDVRQWWVRFAHTLYDALREHGHRALVLSAPNWRLTPGAVNALEPDVIFVPHRQAFQAEGFSAPALYWMQMFARHLFTVDPLGWGPTGSEYPCDFSSGDPASGVYEAMRADMLAENVSKFDQPALRGCDVLRAVGDLPREPYVFFPCQIPHDETIQFHSDYSEVEVVAALAEWANTAKVPVVFKEHPVNRASMAPLRRAAPESDQVIWFDEGHDASVHDLIEGSAAVYTINSGVGFEAILHGKPVVTFGRSEYDCVTWHGQIGALGLDWSNVAEGSPLDISQAYRRFIDWYCRHRAVDLSDDANLPDRMAAVVRLAERTAQA